MYTATSIDVFIAAYSGALGGWLNQQRTKARSAAQYQRLCLQALAFAEEFDTLYASVMPNELQLANIESAVSEYWNAYNPPGGTASITASHYAVAAQNIINVLSESDAIVAANVTNPIPVPVPVSTAVFEIATVTGVSNSLKSTTPTTAVAALVDGYAAKGDAGGGMFYWDPTSALTDDSGTIINPTAHVGPGRWIRVYTGDLWVEWFGGKSNALFFKSANGKWYADAGFVTEASDDAVKFNRAKNSAVANGVNTIRMGAGNWYFTTKFGAAATTTKGNEFILWASGLTLRGAGRDNTFIRIAPGCNTVLFGGYSAVFGVIDFGGTDFCDNAHFEDFTVDKNGTFNLYYAPNTGLDTTFAANADIGITNGDNVTVDRCRTININSTFVLLLGAYGLTANLTNWAIRNCVLEQFSNDPNNLDASYIATGARYGKIRGNIVNGGAPFGVSSLPFTPWTAFENHGRHFSLTDNLAILCNGGYILGADSESLENVTFEDNTSRGCTAGLEFIVSSQTFKRVNVVGNLFEKGWFGIQYIQSGGSPGLIQDVLIDDNQFVNPLINAGTNVAIQILAASTPDASNGGITISNNHAVGYPDGGIIVGVQDNTTVMNGMLIKNNWLEQCGPSGILVTAPAGGGAANVKNLLIDDNLITDNQGILVDGILVEAFCDLTCFVGMGNVVRGESGLPVKISTAVYGGNACRLGVTSGQIMQQLTDNLAAHPAVNNVLTDLQSITIVTTGGDLQIDFAACVNIDTAAGQAVFQIWLDGANTGPDAANNGTSCQVVTGNTQAACSISKRITGVAPGSHTVKSRWMTTNGAVTAVINGVFVPSFATLTVTEVNR